MTDIERWATAYNARIFARMEIERARDREDAAWLAEQTDAELKALSATLWLVTSQARNRQVRENALAKYYAVEGEIPYRRNARPAATVTDGQFVHVQPCAAQVNAACAIVCTPPSCTTVIPHINEVPHVTR